MNLAAVPQPVLLKLLQLDQIAQQLSAAADRLDGRIDSLRHKGSGSGWTSAIESELKEALTAQPKARQRADKAMHLASGCKLYLDRLDDNAVLDLVEVMPTADLLATRARIAALGEERRAINAPPAPSGVERRGRALGRNGRRARQAVTTADRQRVLAEVGRLGQYRPLRSAAQCPCVHGLVRS